MKKEGKYRFSLQFGMATESDIRAGEFLERLGNKKSAVIVAALNDYLNRNPELLHGQKDLKIQVETTRAIGRKELEGIVQRVVKEQLINVSGFTSTPAPDSEESLREDIEQMLDNLALFK